ncbi:MAG: hypothetical protein WBD27_15290 [Pyrinomonadaceae bacterium]
MKRLALALVCTVALFAMGFAVFFQVSSQHHIKGERSNDSGSSATSATVTFGGWMANPHLCPAVPPNPPAPCPIVDRFPANAATQFPRLSNHHALTPQIAKIKAGGTVNFVVSGFHVVTVYDNGTRPADIDTTILVPPPRPGPPIINDARNRIYRGLDPTLLTAILAQDRVESVQFERPGMYLVICAVLPHFQEGMYGYVKVTGRDDDDDDDESR